jgi:hypothetical protein
MTAQGSEKQRPAASMQGLQEWTAPALRQHHGTCYQGAAFMSGNGKLPDTRGDSLATKRAVTRGIHWFALFTWRHVYRPSRLEFASTTL